jgi:hypothetical protein
MSAKVIQGWFIGGQPRFSSAVQPKIVMPRPMVSGRLQPARSQVRPPRPPALAFVAGPMAVQRHAAHGAFAVEVGQLGLISGGGRPLPEAVRGKMEAALGADFSAVRVHVGPQAERIGAIAFTLGSDIYFAPGRYQPDTVPGQQLLGHELAHVVQQRAGRVRNPLGSGLAIVQDHALEAEADRLGQRAAAPQIAVQAKILPSAMQPRASVAGQRVALPPPMQFACGRHLRGKATGSTRQLQRGPSTSGITMPVISMSRNPLATRLINGAIRSREYLVVGPVGRGGTGNSGPWQKNLVFQSSPTVRAIHPPAVAQLVRATIPGGRSNQQGQWTNGTLTGFLQDIVQQLDDPELQNEIDSGCLTQQDIANLQRWQPDAAQQLAMLIQANPQDIGLTMDQIKARANPIAQAFHAALIPMINMARTLNESFQAYGDHLIKQAAEQQIADAKAKSSAKIISNANKSAKQGPIEIDQDAQKQETAAYEKFLKLKNYGNCCVFRQYVPVDAASIQKALKSQKITDAVYNEEKAFWVVINNSKYDLSDASGKVRMEYTFSAEGARSLFEDKLVCQNVGQRVGETEVPDGTLWKTVEEGARGIGKSRLKELEGSCQKIEAYQSKTKTKVQIEK